MLGTYYNTLSHWFPNRASESAFALFCQPRKGHILAPEATFLATSDDQKFLNTHRDQIKTYLWNATGRRTILLLHGWESNAARWKALITYLIQDDFRVVAIDAPAHGASSAVYFDAFRYAEFVEVAMQTYQPEVAIGHSMGGMSLTYYLTHFDAFRLSKMILLGVPSELDGLFQLYTRTLGLSPRMVDLIYAHFTRTFRQSVFDVSVKEFCKKIKVPALIIHDEEDSIAPVADSQAYINNLQDAELLLTRGLGHSLQSEEVYLRILTFLNEKSN